MEHCSQAIAIGNRTAGRETESFIRALGLPAEIIVASVNESGASVFSASEAARREFPDHDVTVRGAVSIGRRLMDPMAEMVKICLFSPNPPNPVCQPRGFKLSKRA